MAGWVVALLGAAHFAPAAYYEAVQEDRATEWLTAACFLAAAILGGARALRDRRVLDGLVALFCIAAAGEEISWGQRLVGYTPPAIFLERNVQQEANLHNLVEVFGQPKWTLIAILALYGIVTPLATRYVDPLRRLAARGGLTAPPGWLLPGFALTIGLLIVYPVRFTGEWAEALAGMLFLAALAPNGTTLAAALVTAGAVAVAMERLTMHGRAADAALVACARAEVERLASAVAADAWLAARPRRRVHRRVWSLVDAHDLQPAVLRALDDVPCAVHDGEQAATRRAYGVDPWGTAYWVRVEAVDAGRRIEVYSFGPNRRRDPGAGDDVRARAD